MLDEGCSWCSRCCTQSPARLFLSFFSVKSVQIFVYPLVSREASRYPTSLWIKDILLVILMQIDTNARNVIYYLFVDKRS